MAGCSGVDRPRPVWGADDACLVTELRHFPSGAFEVHVLIAAGNMETLVNEIIKRVEAWGRHIGALFVTIASRCAAPMQIGRAHVGTQGNNRHIVCRLLLEKDQLTTVEAMTNRSQTTA